MKSMSLVGLPLLALTLTGCTTLPSGPSVMVLPGTGKSFEQFRVDDMNCRQYAFGQIGGVTAGQAATSSAVSSAAVGTAVGALAGAALGGHGRDAATGAGVGLLAGSSIGAQQAQYSGYGTQQRYDMAYVQCMYASGHRVPVHGNMMSSPGPSYPAPPPPPGYRIR